MEGRWQKKSLLQRNGRGAAPLLGRKRSRLSGARRSRARRQRRAGGRRRRRRRRSSSEDSWSPKTQTGRRLPTAGAAFEARVFQAPALPAAAMWAAKAVRPAQLDQIVTAGRLGGEAFGELRRGAQIVLHPASILADCAPLSQMDSRFSGVHARAERERCGGSGQPLWGGRFYCLSQLERRCNGARHKRRSRVSAPPCGLSFRANLQFSGLVGSSTFTVMLSPSQGCPPFSVAPHIWPNGGHWSHLGYCTEVAIAW